MHSIYAITAPDQLKRSNRFGMIDRTPGMMGGRLGQGMGQGMGQGKGPDMGQGMGPGIGPVMGPGMGPGMGPDMGPGKGPGYVPGMGPGGQGGMTYPPTTTTRGRKSVFLHFMFQLSEYPCRNTYDIFFRHTTRLGDMIIVSPRLDNYQFSQPRQIILMQRTYSPHIFTCISCYNCVEAPFVYHATRTFS